MGGGAACEVYWIGECKSCVAVRTDAPTDALFATKLHARSVVLVSHKATSMKHVKHEACRHSCESMHDGAEPAWHMLSGWLSYEAG